MTLIARPVQVAVIVAGSAFGAYGVAIAYASSNAFLWLFGLAWVSRWGTMPVRAMFSTAGTSVLGYATAAAVGAAASEFLLPSGRAVAIGGGAVVFAATLGLLIALWPGFRRQVLTLRALRAPRGRSGLEGA